MTLNNQYFRLHNEFPESIMDIILYQSDHYKRFVPKANMPVVLIYIDDLIIFPLVYFSFKFNPLRIFRTMLCHPFRESLYQIELI